VPIGPGQGGQAAAGEGGGGAAPSGSRNRGSRMGRGPRGGTS
jgi:hypothetical protein